MPLQTAIFPDYFSIDDILATQERIQCKFLQDVPKLGQLNSTEETVDLTAGTTLEIPMWLTCSISTNRQPIITPSLPKVYKEGYREILKADPCAVDLHKVGPYFYELGFYAKQFDLRGEVADILLQTFTLRFRNLMDCADNSLSDLTITEKLDSLERMILKEAQEARIKLSQWLKLSEIPLEAATMVANHKKRKRVDL